MAELCPFKVGAKVASWTILCRKLAIVAIFLRYGHQICFPISSIDIKVLTIKGQTKLEVNWTQIDHLSLQKPQKWPYLKITQKPTPPAFFHEFV